MYNGLYKDLFIYSEIKCTYFWTVLAQPLTHRPSYITIKPQRSSYKVDQLDKPYFLIIQSWDSLTGIKPRLYIYFPCGRTFIRTCGWWMSHYPLADSLKRKSRWRGEVNSYHKRGWEAKPEPEPEPEPKQKGLLFHHLCKQIFIGFFVCKVRTAFCFKILNQIKYCST